MLVEIAYRGNARAANADAIDYRFDALGFREHQPIRTVIVRVADITKVRLCHQLGAGDEKAGRPIFDRAVITAGLQRIEALGVALLDMPDAPLLWEIEYDEINSIAGDRKQCSHQERRGVDLFCVAAEEGSSPKDVPKDRRARTTLHACENTCKLPDTRLLCSSFVHLQMLMAHPYPPAPVVGPRVCEIGQQKRIEAEPIQCTPDGYDCWRRVLNVRTESNDASLPPLALNEALDFLSWVWRAKFPASQTKLINLTSSTNAAEIGQPCLSLETFRSRMNALADLLDALKIDGNLLATPGVTGTLNRMQDVLRARLPQAEFDRADAGILVLRNATDLRNGLHHSDAGRKMPLAARKFGLDWPPADWRRAWEHVRDHATRAVREIRQSIEVTI